MRGSKTNARKLRGIIASQHFAILATAGADDGPHAAGVSYAAAIDGRYVICYVMTRRHLRKARDIARDPRVSLVIPIPRRLLWSMPPATIQLQGRAELVPQDDPVATDVFQRFFLGRRILASYAEMRERGERRICFVRITLDPIARSYMVGASLLQAARSMHSAAAATDLRTGL